MANSLPSHFATLATTDRSQNLHIADSNGTPILSTNSESPALAALSQALVTSSSATAHLGLGRVVGVHAQYSNGEVVQMAKLDAQTGVIATVAGKEVNGSQEVRKIINVVHAGLQGNADGQGVWQRNIDGREENGKTDRRGSNSSGVV